MTRDDQLDQLILHEGTGPIKNGRLMPYRDTKGLLSIGHGRNLDANGVRQTEARIMLVNDVRDAEQECRFHFPWFEGLDMVRQAVLTELMFNMGWGTFSKFVATLAAVEAHNFVDAAKGLRASKWYRDVKEVRGERITSQMQTGFWA